MNETYLVVGLRGLILRDIVGILENAYPQLVPRTVQSMNEAIASVSLRDRVMFAFLNVAPDTFFASELSSTLKTLGTRVIFMGSEAEDASESLPFSVLTRPFTEADVMNALKVPV